MNTMSSIMGVFFKEEKEEKLKETCGVLFSVLDSENKGYIDFKVTSIHTSLHVDLYYRPTNCHLCVCVCVCVCVLI